jgi:transcriptional regulator with XRE-family HTH domain
MCAKVADAKVEGWTEEFRDRFAIVVDAVGGREAAADLVGYSADQISNWRQGRSAAPLFRVADLCDRAGVTLDWLLTGHSGRLAGIDPMQFRAALDIIARLDPGQDRFEAVRTISLSDLRTDPVFERATDWFARTGGNFSADDRYTGDVERASVVHAAPEASLPEYLHCGPGSVVATYYGHEFARDPRAHSRTLDRELETRAAFEYRRVVDAGEPRASWVSTNVTIENVTRHLRYNRLVMPVRYRDVPAVMVLCRETHPPMPVAG